MTLREVKKVATQFNATVIKERVGNTNSLEIEAPKGFVWCEGGVHVIVDASYYPFPNDYEDVLSRMRFGLEPCTQENCDCFGEE